MRRAVITTFSTTAGIVLLLSLKPHSASQPSVQGAASTRQGTSARPSGGWQDGTHSGQVVPTRYGPVQVSVVISGGRLTKVHVLQVPSENGRDQEIARYAVPRLTAEAVGAQGAGIDMVTGATYTSQGYISSLQSALDGARA